MKLEMLTGVVATGERKRFMLFVAEVWEYSFAMMQDSLTFDNFEDFVFSFEQQEVQDSYDYFQLVDLETFRRIDIEDEDLVSFFIRFFELKGEEAAKTAELIVSKFPMCKKGMQVDNFSMKTSNSFDNFKEDKQSENK